MKIFIWNWVTHLHSGPVVVVAETLAEARALLPAPLYGWRETSNEPPTVVYELAGEHSRQVYR